MGRNCHVVRVFTRELKGGNHLGVVTDAEDLATARMQEIAADLGFSETIFYLPGDPPEVRIFTPGREMPFAGHPLVGMAWTMRQLELTDSGFLRCGIGDVAVGASADVAWIEVAGRRPVRPAPTATAVADRLQLTAPIDSGWVDMPIPYLLLELPGPADVQRARFRVEEMGEVGELYLYARRGAGEVRARFFAPEAGVFEDPATGSAAVALASLEMERGRLEGSLAVDQGDELGQPSTIELSWEPDRIRIAGGVALEEIRSLGV